jgi:hypothetical protein
VSTVLLHLRPGVREHFMDRLGVWHPDLLPRYERLYRRADAPKHERQRVGALVRAAVRAAGGLSAPRLDPEHLVGRPPQARAVPVAAPRRTTRPAEQLGLGL